MKHCGRDKFSSEITPAPPQDFLDKETERKAKIQLHTLPPVKSFLLSSLYTDKCSSLCYLNSLCSKQVLQPMLPNNLPLTRSYPHYQKKLHSVLISCPHCAEGLVSYSWCHCLKRRDYLFPEVTQ